jgi:hypothetical protein
VEYVSKNISKQFSLHIRSNFLESLTMNSRTIAIAALLAVSGVAASAASPAPQAFIGQQSDTSFALSRDNTQGGLLETVSIDNVAKAPASYIPGTTAGFYLAGEPGNSAVVTLGNVESVSFQWGTPDASWNTLSILESNGISYDFTPAASSLNLDGGSNSTYVDFFAGAGLTIEKLTFASSTPAFEAADFKVSAGLFGFMARKRRI